MVPLWNGWRMPSTRPRVPGPVRPLWTARAGVRLPVLAALAAVVAAAVALPVLAVGVADTAVARGAAEVLAAQPVRAAAVSLSAPLDDDVAQQRRQVGAAIAARLPARVASVTWSASATTVLRVGGVGREARITADPRLPSVTRTVSGRWPAGPAADGLLPAAVQADAARRLGLVVGDTVQVDGGPTLRVAATWRAADPGAVRWAGASDVATGTDRGVVGPVVVAPGDLAGVGGSASATWTVTPRTDHGALVDADRLAAGLRALRTAAAGDSGVLGGSDLTGDLGRTLARIASADTAARALVRIAVLVGAVLALVAAGVVLGRLRDARRPETALFTARGATRGQLVRWAAAEAVVVAAVGAAVGIVAGVWIAALAGTVPGPTTWLTAGVAAVLVTAGAAAGTTARRTSDGRAGAWGAVAVAVLLAGVAALTTWRLVTVGLLTRDAAGRIGSDPVASVAPVSTVLAVGLLTVLLVGIVASVAARFAAGSRGLTVALVARRLARTWSATAPVVVLVTSAVAVGGLVVGVQATTAVTEQRAGAAVVGPDVRVTADGDDVVRTDSVVTPAVRERHVTASVPALVDRVGVGDQQAVLVAVPADRVGAVLGGGAGGRGGAAAGGGGDAAGDGAGAGGAGAGAAGAPVGGGGAWAGTAVGARAGTALPGDARAVTVTVSVGGATLLGAPRAEAVGTVRTTLWVVDGDGLAAALPLSGPGATADVPLGRTATLRTELPAAGHDWRVLAVEPALTFSARPTEASPTLDRLQVPVDVSVEGVAGARGHADVVDLKAGGRIPLGPTPAESRLPVVLTTALAERLRVQAGSPLDLGPAATGGTVRATVVRTVPVVDGSGDPLAVAADLPSLTDLSVLGGPALPSGVTATGRVSDTWVASTDPAATRRAAERSAVASGSVTTRAAVSSAPVLRPAVGTLAAVAGGGTLLALGVLALVALGDGEGRVGRSRVAGPPAVFRALGVPPGVVGRTRAAVLALPVLAAVVGGVVGGAVTAAGAAASFAAAAVPGSIGTVTVQPLSPWLAAVPGAVLVGTLVVVVTAGVRAARSVAEARR